MLLSNISIWFAQIINGLPLTIFGLFTVVFFTLTVGDAYFDWENYPWEYADTTIAAATNTVTQIVCNTVVSTT